MKRRNNVKPVVRLMHVSTPNQGPIEIEVAERNNWIIIVLWTRYIMYITWFLSTYLLIYIFFFHFLKNVNSMIKFSSIYIYIYMIALSRILYVFICLSVLYWSKFVYRHNSQAIIMIWMHSGWLLSLNLFFSPHPKKWPEALCAKMFVQWYWNQFHALNGMDKGCISEKPPKNVS